MDKMIQSATGDVTITNDGATILKQMSVLHPVARMVSYILNSAHPISLIFALFLACGVGQSTGYRGRGWDNDSGGFGRESAQPEPKIVGKR